eukprot:TRINITY_DN6141_c0_g1_i4.p1 TRINITY_DN6141_c0_g1~~TRINITY_DN6141_c0_g1_i4.p1  ORF type:complete len:374 (-),score=84.17 TRINITY_DN6141_c0_g1_i4:298-1419(-)
MRFRSAYCSVLLNVFVDCYPQKNATRISYVWPLKKADRLLGNTGGSPQVIKSVNSGKLKAPKPDELKSASNLNEFLKGYMYATESFPLESNENRTSHWKFYLKMIRLVRISYSFGFFKRDEELFIPRLKELLDISWPSINNGNIEEYQLLLSIKLEACQIIDYYLDFKQKYTFESFIANTMENLTTAGSLSEEKLKDQMTATLEDQMRALEEGNDQWGLCEKIVPLLKHEHDPLTSASINLLARLQRDPRAELVLAVSQIKFVTKPQEIKDFEEIAGRSDRLRKLTAQKMSAAERDEVVAIIQQYSELCEGDGHPKSTNQHAFFSENIHEEVMNILKLPVQADFEGMSKVFTACYVFLKNFCRSNPHTQKNSG